MAPFRDTMCLVNSNKTHAAGDMLHTDHETLVVEPLGRAVNDPQLSSAQLHLNFLQLFPRFGGINAFCGDFTSL